MYQAYGGNRVFLRPGEHTWKAYNFGRIEVLRPLKVIAQVGIPHLVQLLTLQHNSEEQLSWGSKDDAVERSRWMRKSLLLFAQVVVAGWELRGVQERPVPVGGPDLVTLK